MVTQLTALWKGVNSTLREPGEFTVYITRYHSGKPFPYSACEAHFVAWNGYWISTLPFEGQGAAIEAMALFEQGRR